MFDSKYYESRIAGEVYTEEFERFLPTEDNPCPEARIAGFMVNGPYVLVTDGALETEYLYQRHKVLDEDYLKEEGGESAVVPYIGLSHDNHYLGDKVNSWRAGQRKWGTLRFDKEDYDACGDALFLTEQRNCAYFAAVYVNCKTDYDAVICYETSGSHLYVNGEIIDKKPYGRVKGLWDFGNLVLAHFHKGMNLVMLKIRTGYICDTIDITVSNFAVYPVMAASGSLGVCRPTRTRTYFGTKDAPRQVLPVFTAALNDTKGGAVTLANESVPVKAMKKGAVSVVRASIPATGQMEPYTMSVTETGGASAAFSGAIPTIAFDGFIGKEHIYSDFHFDTTYHQEQRTYAMGAIDILSKMLVKLRANPDFKAILSEVDYLHPYYSIYANDRETLRDTFKSGRAEADCFYNQPNEMTSSPEGLVRNLVYGQLYHRDVLGRLAYVYGPGDVFGHPNQLSQICEKGGCEGIYWGKHIYGLDCLFNHMSPDGTTLVHHRGGVSRDNALLLGVKNAHDSSGVDFTCYAREDDTSWMKKTLSGAQFSVMSDFIRGVNKDDAAHIEENGESLFETTSRDISLYHAGVALTRQDLKRANRLGENLLITAEKFASIAAYYGATYPEEALDKAWRQILCGQHHDSITGTNNEISFVDLMIEYREACILAADVIDRALSYIVSGVKAFGLSPVVVFNPHAYDRKDVCTLNLPLDENKTYVMADSKGKRYPVQIAGKNKAVFTPDVPALGYKVFSLEEAAAEKSSPKTDENIVENEFYRVTVDPRQGGGIVSLFDKKAKKEIVCNTGAVYALKELRDRMETQHEFYTTGEKLSSAEYPATVKRETGTVYDKLIITSNMGILCGLKQEITLTKGIRRIDVRLSLENYTGDDHLFSYNLPVDVAGGKAVFDDRFAPAVKPKSRFVLDFKTHQFLMASHCSVFAANQWFALGSTVTVKLGAKGNINLGTTALIAPQNDAFKDSSLVLTEILTKKAVPVTPYPDRKRAVHATLLPHFNDDLHFTDTRVVLSLQGIDNEYENKLLSDGKIREKFDAALEKKGFAALYTVDKDNLWDKPIDVILLKAKDEATLQRAIGDIGASLDISSGFALSGCIAASPVPPAEDYTVAVLNRGNLASSIEADDSLSLMLFHTALFYGNSGKVTGGRELVPEQKSHVYEFALMPHSGSYREGQEYIRALEYNDPLLAVNAADNKNAVLPETMSFVRCSENFLLTSFKAGGYPLASQKGVIPPIAERGFALRGFEQDGVNADVSVKCGFDILSVMSANLLEEDTLPVKHTKHGFESVVYPHSIETFLIDPADSDKSLGGAVLGAVAEEIQPTYIRSWEHSRGSMPFSYLRTTAVIDRKVETVSGTRFVVNVSVVNNRIDSAIEGTARLVLPDGFKADKTVFEYKLAANEHLLVPVTIDKSDADKKGILYLYFEDGANTFYDVLEIGFFYPSVSMTTDGKQIAVTVRNDTDQPLLGELAMATPLESFGLPDKITDSLCEITPMAQLVELPAKSHKVYTFDVKEYENGVFNAFWACAKLMVNGRVYYAYRRHTGELRNMWAHTFVDRISAAGNSQRAYLTLKDGMPVD